MTGAHSIIKHHVCIPFLSMSDEVYQNTVPYSTGRYSTPIQIRLRTPTAPQSTVYRSREISQETSKVLWTTDQSDASTEELPFARERRCWKNSAGAEVCGGKCKAARPQFRDVNCSLTTRQYLGSGYFGWTLQPSRAWNRASKL